MVSTQTMDVRCQCEGLRQILSQFYCFPAHQHQPTMGHFWSLLSVFTQPSPTTIYCRLEHTETKAEKCLSIHGTISRGLLFEQDHNILHFTILWKQDTFGPCVNFHIEDLYLTVDCSNVCSIFFPLTESTLLSPKNCLGVNILFHVDFSPFLRLAGRLAGLVERCGVTNSVVIA